MSHEESALREALLKEMYAAFNRREIDRVLASMHPDVVWPNGWEGGFVHGHDGVRAYWTRQWAAIDPTVTPRAFAEEADGRVCVTVDSVVRDFARTLISENTVEHVYEFEDGLVKTMEIRPRPSP